MSRDVQAVVLLIIGVVIGHLTLSDAYLNFVKSTLQLPLLASAAVLVALGLLSLLRDNEDDLAAPDPDLLAPAPGDAGVGDGVRTADDTVAADGVHAFDPVRTGSLVTLRPPSVLVADAADPGEPVDPHDGGAAGHDGHGHDHSRAPRIGMLVLAPILALLLIAPQPLGSYAASRGGANRVAAPVLELPPLGEPVDGAVPLTIGDTVVRALYEPDGPLIGTTVRLVGFVSDDDDPGRYRLSRFSVACCAADASVRQVVVAGGSPGFEEDTWVEVIARFEGAVHDPDGEGGSVGVPIVTLLSEREIERPASPYEY